ncbi:acyltransferase [Candidatus Enterovibrio escicola]|uniref:Acetyltransferase SypM n=1 Tax=Candidatus Enterovibrio escicola TaxID=1927127 RepID=A0A2A5T2R6_9GAMM|nr:acyltransferase [Candidatus Enterovibrio escacola]PCS22459.1 Acetyltransferase SypM [Candidatus Enterovibrio escacola]
MAIQSIRHWLKNSQNPLAQWLFHALNALILMSIPAPKVIFLPLYYITTFLMVTWTNLTRTLWWTPLFKGRLQHVGRGLYLYGGIPYISGPLHISIGERCRISGQSTFSGRAYPKSGVDGGNKQPKLLIGNNIDIGWQTTIAVGQKIVIGDNVRISGRAFLTGYPGHPINAEDRAAGLPELDCQIGDIILEKDVWLATGVSVMAGVTIGHGTIVATGSVVTSDLPPNVLAGGMPAKIIRRLTDAEIETYVDKVINTRGVDNTEIATNTEREK